MATGAALAAAGLGAMGALQQGAAASSAAKYNAKLAELNALQTLDQASGEERQQRVIGQKALGDMRAAYGKAGVTMEGSALEALAESAANVERDALTIRRQGLLRANSYENQGALYKAQARNAMTGAYLGAASSLLGGIGGL